MPKLEDIDVKVNMHMVGVNVGWTCPVCGIGVSPVSGVCPKCLEREKPKEEKSKFKDTTWTYEKPQKTPTTKRKRPEKKRKR